MSDNPYYRYLYSPSRYRHGYTPASVYSRYTSRYPTTYPPSYTGLYGGSRYGSRYGSGIESYGVDYYDYLRYQTAAASPRYGHRGYGSYYYY